MKQRSHLTKKERKYLKHHDLSTKKRNQEKEANLIQEYRVRYPTPRRREQCYICKGWREICQWHHVPSIEDVVASSTPVHPWFEWPMYPLCPNHHIIMHRIMRGRKAPPWESTELPLEAVRQYFQEAYGEEAAVGTSQWGNVLEMLRQERFAFQALRNY